MVTYRSISSLLASVLVIAFQLVVPLPAETPSARYTIPKSSSPHTRVSTVSQTQKGEVTIKYNHQAYVVVNATRS